jgi:hypothetical protein
MNTIRRIALTAAAALCIATPAAQAASITVTHNGREVTLLDDEQFTSDVVDAIDRFHALEASRSKPPHVSGGV